jgi:flagellar biosynthesis/type III secretory pathway M-ring protein FliF/YscJ
MMEKYLRQNIDNMLDAIYGPTVADPNTAASVDAVFDHINRVGMQIGTNQTIL